MAEHGKALAEMFNRTELAEVVRVTEGEGQVSLLYRVRDKRVWLNLMEYLLRKKTCWEAHLCQQYFLRGQNLVYGWNFILQSSEMEKAIDEILKLLVSGLKEAPKTRTRGPIESFPLVGASPRRTAQLVWDPRQPGPDRGGLSHKGAHAIR